MNVELMRKRSEALVIAMIGKDLAPKWWDGQNKAFELRTPNQQWEIDPTEVYAYLMRHADYTC